MSGTAEEQPSRAAETPELPEPDNIGRILSVVDPRDRRTVTVLMAVIVMGMVSFTAWATLSTHEVEFVHDRIQTEVVPVLQDHEKRIKDLVDATSTQGTLVRDTHDAVIEIRQALRDRKMIPAEHVKPDPE